MNDILAIDVGTTTFKVGVFSLDLDKKCETSRLYEPNLYDFGKADIEPEKWWNVLQDCCAEIKSFLRSVSVISLSVTTPGLVAMNEAGTALGPAILFLMAVPINRPKRYGNWLEKRNFFARLATYLFLVVPPFLLSSG